MFRQLAVVSVAALIFSVGCASNTGLTGARAIAEEELQVGVALSFLPSFVESDIVGLPVLDLIFRYGLSAEQDLGFRINTLGAFAVDTKYEVTDEEDYTVALMGAVGFNFGTFISKKVMASGTLVQFEVDVLADYHVDQDITLTAIPKYQLLLRTSDGYVRHYVGGEVAGQFALDDMHEYVLQPYGSTMFGLYDEGDLLNTVGAYGLGVKFN